MTVRPHVAKTQLNTTNIHIARFADRNDPLVIAGADGYCGLCRGTSEAGSHPVEAFFSIGITDAGESAGATWNARIS